MEARAQTGPNLNVSRSYSRTISGGLAMMMVLGPPSGAVLNVDLLGRILEPVLRRRTVLHLGQVLDLLQLLELFVVAYVRVVRRQTHQIVHEAENDQQTGDGGEDEHDFTLFHPILAERFHLRRFADFHILLLDAIGEHKV